MSGVEIHRGDCLDIFPSLARRRVNLTFGSPPYEAARTYGIGFKLRGMDWVNWAADRFMGCLSVTDGLVAWVIQGQTRNYAWSGVPMLLGAELIRRGAFLRNPPIFKRVGIPGSGGPDWLRSDYGYW